MNKNFSVLRDNLNTRRCKSRVGISLAMMGGVFLALEVVVLGIILVNQVLVFKG